VPNEQRSAGDALRIREARLEHETEDLFVGVVFEAMTRVKPAAEPAR
jgi:hypothetical protein